MKINVKINEIIVNLAQNSSEIRTPFYIHELTHYDKVTFKRNHISVEVSFQELSEMKNFLLGLDGLQGKFVIENVKPYYEYLIAPSVHIGRHPFWTNSYVPDAKFTDKRVHNNISGNSEVYGVSLKKYDDIGDKRKMLRNMVNPEVGLYLLEMAVNAVTGVKGKVSKSYTPCLF